MLEEFINLQKYKNPQIQQKSAKPTRSRSKFLLCIAIDCKKLYISINCNVVIHIDKFLNLLKRVIQQITLFLKILLVTSL